MSAGYGFFPGGDPRRFHPDPEMSTDDERAKHKRDCEAWNRGECPNVNDKAPHVEAQGDNWIHRVPAGYGLGSYDYDEYDDDMPEDLREHDYRDGCECDRCHDARVLARFRGEQTPSLYADGLP